MKTGMGVPAERILHGINNYLLPNDWMLYLLHVHANVGDEKLLISMYLGTTSFLKLISTM